MTTVLDLVLTVQPFPRRVPGQAWAELTGGAPIPAAPPGDHDTGSDEMCARILDRLRELR